VGQGSLLGFERLSQWAKIMRAILIVVSAAMVLYGADAATTGGYYFSQLLRMGREIGLPFL